VDVNILWDDQLYDVKMSAILWCEAEVRSKHVRADFTIKGWLARDFVTDLYRSRYYTNHGKQNKKGSSVSEQQNYYFLLKALIMY
jgi:hypothetical protein